MNADTGNPAGADSPGDGFAVTKLTDILVAVTERDHRWNVIPSRDGVQLCRGWEDGTVDTMFIASPGAAYGVRQDPGGREVWGTGGTADQVVAAVSDLPAPLEPGAPDGADHRPRPDGRWSS